MVEYFKFENLIFFAGKFVKLYPIMKEFIGKSDNEGLKI